MGPSLFHRQTHTHAPPDISSLPPIAPRPSLALTGLSVFSASAAPVTSRPTDGLAFVPYAPPCRGKRDAMSMGDVSYELAHPSKFSDWTDDGDERALPPPSLGIALLSKARAAIKASKEAVSSASRHEAEAKTTGIPTSSNSRSRAPTISPFPTPKAESPIHRWLDLGLSLSPPCSPGSEFRQSRVQDELRQASGRMTAFQFLEGGSQLASPSRIRRQTDAAGRSPSYVVKLETNERTGTQAAFLNHYPDFEVDTRQDGPSSSNSKLGKPFQQEPPTGSTSKTSRRITTASVLRPLDQTEVIPRQAESSRRSLGPEKGSISRKGRESLFSTFKRRDRARSKARAEDAVQPPGRSHNFNAAEQSASDTGNSSALRQSLPPPPMRGLRAMFSMEPIVQIVNQSTNGAVSEKPLPVPPTEFGMMVRAPTAESPVVVPAVVSLNSPPQKFDTSPLLGNISWRYSSSPNLASSQMAKRLRQLTGETTLVGSTTPVQEISAREPLSLGSPMVTPSKSPLASGNVLPFSPTLGILGTRHSPVREIGSSFLSLGSTPSPTKSLQPSPSQIQELSPARDDISLLDPDAFRPRDESSPPLPPPTEQEITEDISRSPTPETDGQTSPRTKRVRSLTDMRDAFRRMQAFTGLEVSECDSRRTSTTVGGDAEDDDILGGSVKKLGFDEEEEVEEDHEDDYTDLHKVVIAHIESVNLVLAQPVISNPVPAAEDPAPAPPSIIGEDVIVASETVLSTQSTAMVTAQSHQSTSLGQGSLEDRSAPSAGDLLDDSRDQVPHAASGRSFYTALDDVPSMPRSLSKSSSLGAISTRNTTDSLLEHIEKREGSGWWSDSSKVEDKVKADELVDKRLAALEDKVKSSPSPFKSIWSSNNTPLADSDSTPRQSGLGHTPRLSLVGDSTWSQGEDGSPVRLAESPRRIRAKKREARSRTQSDNSPKRLYRNIDSEAGSSIGEGLPAGLTLKSPFPFARKVSPDIARRAGLITHPTRQSTASKISPTRSRVPRTVRAGPSRRNDDDEIQSSQGSQSGSEMSSLCKLEMELGSTVRRRGKEIDTLISTLTQTRRENSTLRSQVVHKHAIMGDMLEENQEMKDEIRQLKQKLARAERESAVISPIRQFGSVRSDRSSFRGTPEPRRRSSLARVTVTSEHDRTSGSRSGYRNEDVEFIDHYDPETPTRRTSPYVRSSAKRRISSARSDLSGTSAGVSIRSSPSSRV